MYVKFVVISFCFLAAVAESNDNAHIRKVRMTYANPTKIEKYPYVAFGGHCTASIIHERYLLSAVHCYQGANPSDLSFWVGVDDRNNLSAGVQHFAEATFPALNYGPYVNISFDIMLIRLAQPITFNSRAQPINLNTELVLKLNENVIATGFGKTESGGYSQELREGNFAFASYDFLNTNFKNFMKTLSPNNGLSVGDSGSPAAICRCDAQCRPNIYQVGTAFTAGSETINGTKYYRGIYTKMSDSSILCTWLKEKSNNEIEC